MRQSGQPRPGPASIGGLTGGPIIGIAISLFAIITFPPLGLLVGAIVGLTLFTKFMNRRDRKRGDRKHRAKMDDWYQKQEDARREEYYAQRTFVNPGWSV